MNEPDVVNDPTVLPSGCGDVVFVPGETVKVNLAGALTITLPLPPEPPFLVV